VDGSSRKTASLPRKKKEKQMIMNPVIWISVLFGVVLVLIF